MSGNEQSGSEVLVLPVELSIQEVDDWQSRLQSILENIETPVLSAAEVERVDTAFLQLLTSFCETCRQQHRAVVWKGCSSNFRISAALLGLEQALGIHDQPAGID
ncbi:MAG: STAS domain-containing protein [Marinobacterium sp.]|nr:STAS domain-containing protein [Marinobacterium sp.]